MFSIARGKVKTANVDLMEVFEISSRGHTNHSGHLGVLRPDVEFVIGLRNLSSRFLVSVVLVVHGLFVFHFVVVLELLQQQLLVWQRSQPLLVIVRAFFSQSICKSLLLLGTFLHALKHLIRDDCLLPSFRLDLVYFEKVFAKLHLLHDFRFRSHCHLHFGSVSLRLFFLGLAHLLDSLVNATVFLLFLWLFGLKQG